MRTRSNLTVSCVAAAGILAPLHADAAGDGVLAQMDAALTRARTLEIEYEVVTKEAPDRAERSLGMTVLRKGEKWLSVFTAPADLKGTKLLILSSTQVYVYLPAFGKVRRMAGHGSGQGFLGLAFSPDDLATTTYGTQYGAAILSQDAACWRLTLTPRTGSSTRYARIEVTVGKGNKLPSELEYFNAEGKHLKTETRSGYVCVGAVCIPTEIRMVDPEKGAWTRFTVKKRRIDPEIADGVFIPRNLGE